MMAHGFLTSGDVLSKTADGQPLDSLYRDFKTSIDIVNRDKSSLTNVLTYQTTQHSESVFQTDSNDTFEVASEFGVPKALRADIEPTPLGFPLEWYDSSVRFTEKFLLNATAAQVEAQHVNALNAHFRTVHRAILSALLTKTTIATRPVNEDGTAIYSLYDGEADSVPPPFAGKTFSAGHTHYLTSGASTIDGSDVADLVNHITEHGYGIGSDRVLVIVHPNEGQKIRGFRAGVDSSPFDFIPSENAPAFLTSLRVQGKTPPTDYLGLEVIGSYGPALIVESYYAIAGYLIATATSGTNSPRNPLSFRVHERPGAQGLQLIEGPRRYPLIESTYTDGFGVGVRHRGASAVMKISSGSWSNPTIP
jgi:hypothetical protein